MEVRRMNLEQFRKIIAHTFSLLQIGSLGNLFYTFCEPTRSVAHKKWGNKFVILRKPIKYRGFRRIRTLCTATKRD